MFVCVTGQAEQKPELNLKLTGLATLNVGGDSLHRLPPPHQLQEAIFT